MFAAREGDLESGRVLVAAGADVNAIGGDGKDALGAGDLQRQLRFRLVPDRPQGQRQPGGHAALHAAVLGGRSAQHGNGAELPVDGDGRSAAADQEDARRRRQSERAGQQHAARPHARRLAAHRLRHAADARRLLRRPRADQAAAGLQGRPDDRLQRRRDDGRRGRRPRLHPGLQQGPDRRPSGSRS